MSKKFRYQILLKDLVAPNDVLFVAEGKVYAVWGGINPVQRAGSVCEFFTDDGEYATLVGKKVNVLWVLDNTPCSCPELFASPIPASALQNAFSKCMGVSTTYAHLIVDAYINSEHVEHVWAIEPLNICMLSEEA